MEAEGGTPVATAASKSGIRKVVDSTLARVVGLIASLIGIAVVLTSKTGRDAIGDAWDWAYEDHVWVILIVLLGGMFCLAVALFVQRNQGSDAASRLAQAEAQTKEKDARLRELEDRVRLSDDAQAAALERELTALGKLESQGFEVRRTETAFRVKRPGDDWRSVSLVQETPFEIRQDLRRLAAELRAAGVRLPMSMYDEELRDL